MGFSVDPHIDAHIQQGSYAQDGKLRQNPGIDHKAGRTIVFHQAVPKDGHLLDGENGGQKQNLRATVVKYNTNEKLWRETVCQKVSIS